MNIKKASALLFLAIISVFSVMARTSGENWNKKNSAKWFKSYEWANGIKLKADKSVDQVEFAKQYHANKAYWDLAFAWLRDNDPETVSVGKYVLDSLNNVIVTVTEKASTRDFDKTKWEGHCKYIDLQYIAKGKEKMGIAPIAKAAVSTPYNATKDNGFYTIPEADSKYRVAQPGTFLLFFTSDAHRPNIKVDGYDIVRKIVIKIKADTSVNPEERQARETKQ